ncbi:hypothetical protein D9619_005902 [Psilocybe cf. subviscida]|uniref:Transmembrane protein n=1 Tax=Psilocybe cf. subviscida TaxID=2480587 RepID=A0A8H5BXY1_9AGAR|nr:hypothetical protein D9619_005902 [Psilocybe cf. subviscida]
MLQAAGALFAFSLLLPAGVAAQTSTTPKAQCLSGVATWSYNSEGDSPCDIAMSLAGVCIGTTFTLAPLGDGFVYLGPDVLNATPCRCSSVYYSLLSACAFCQDRQYIDWDRYKSNCTTVYSQVFAQPLPAGVGVPNYAYLDVEASGTFNVTAASTAGGPESTRLPSATGSSRPTGTGGKKSNTGAIAGGVVGGVVALLAIAGLVSWLLRRRRANKVPASSYDPNLLVGPSEPSPQTHNTSPTLVSTPETGYPTTHITGSSLGQKVYDPNDPTTFPAFHNVENATYNPYDSSPNVSSGQTGYQPQMAQYNNGGAAFQQPHTPARPHYTGAPEV